MSIQELPDCIFGEELLVLDVACRKGWRIAYSAIRNNYQLFTLLQTELLPSDTLSCKDRTNRALWTYYQWSGLLPDGQFADFMRVAQRVIGEAEPQTIASLDGQRIMLLGPADVYYSWDAAFAAPAREATQPSLRVVKELSGDEVEAWLTQIRRTPRNGETVSEADVLRPLPSSPCRWHARKEERPAASKRRLRAGGKWESAAATALGLAALVGGIALVVSAAPERDAVRTLWGLFAGLLGLIALPAGLTFALLTLRRQKQLDRLQQSPLIRWTYSPEETRDLCRPEAPASGWIVLAVAGAFGLTLGVALLIPSRLFFTTPPGALLFVPVVTTSLALLVGLTAVVCQQRRRHRLLHSPQDVYLDVHGLYINEEYIPWVGGQQVLSDIRVERMSPLVLLAQFVLYLPAGQKRIDYRIPVPRGEEETALRFLKALQASRR